MMTEWQASPNEVAAYGYADWAGARETRASTSGGCLVVGNHQAKGWTEIPAFVALSLVEGELYSSRKTGPEAQGFIAMAREMGYKLIGKVWSDARAGLGIIHRKGLGRARHT